MLHLSYPAQRAALSLSLDLRQQCLLTSWLVLVCVGMVAVMVAAVSTTTTTPVLATLVRCRDIWDQQGAASCVDVPT